VDSVAGARTFTSAAINAGVIVNVIYIAGNNSVNGTLIFTSAASRANFRVNFKSHDFLFLSEYLGAKIE
jgi:hypothetical protein